MLAHPVTVLSAALVALAPSAVPLERGPVPAAPTVALASDDPLKLHGEWEGTLTVHPRKLETFNVTGKVTAMKKDQITLTLKGHAATVWTISRSGDALTVIDITSGRGRKKFHNPTGSGTVSETAIEIRCEWTQEVGGVENQRVRGTLSLKASND